VTNPLARLFGSLANVVLDLGLPAIRGWLRDRLGPEADVAEVKTNGSIVSLEDVRIPIGPRGLVKLDRAAATITSLGDRGPALRLHSFNGVLTLGGFRANITFAASDDPDPAAWIWGDLTILGAIWPSSTDIPGGPLNGHARLFVSSHEWRLEGARLEGGPSSIPGDNKPPVVARFAAAGSLEPHPEESDSIVPPAIATIAFALEHGRIGPFLDAMGALAGDWRAKIPPQIPRDTRLDGELSWSSAEGARVEFRLDAATIGAGARVRAAFAPNGSGLSGRIDGAFALAAFLRHVGAPALALPRDEDVIAVAATAKGHVRAVEAQIHLSAPAIGWRLGRPRFVPPVTLGNVAGALAVNGGRVTGRVTALARRSEIAVDVNGSELTLNAPAIEAAFLRDVISTLGRRVEVPDDAVASVALSYRTEGSYFRSTDVALATSRSRLTLTGESSAPLRLTGRVAIEDVLATGLVENRTLYPTKGDLDIALEWVNRPGVLAADVRGTVTAVGSLELKVGDRDLFYIVQNARVDVALSGTNLEYRDLRFTGYGGRFAGSGTIPFVARAPDAPPYLVLQLDGGGAELARHLFMLVPEPRPALAFPELSARGQLVLDPHLGIDLVVTTPAGTALSANVRQADIVAQGAFALADAKTLAARELPIAGIIGIDAKHSNGVTRANVDSDAVKYEDFTLERAAVSVIVTHEGDVLWNRLDGRLADGRVTSFGVAKRTGEVLARVSAASVAVHELPPIEGRPLAKYVRGRASGSIVLHRAADLEARGDVVLDEAAFPVIDRARPALERYGLRPPNEDATGPAVATIAIDASGIHLTDVAVDLHGASVRGEVDVGPGVTSRPLQGHIEIVLEEEYLRTSKLLTLPRVLGERLVVPIAIRGTTEKPDIHAEIGQTLGQFVRESKVGEFVSSAVEEAQLFFRSSKRTTMTPPAPTAEPPPPPTWEADLRATIDAHAAEWAALRR
jgi:hypothetical protein